MTPVRHGGIFDPQIEMPYKQNPHHWGLYVVDAIGIEPTTSTVSRLGSMNYTLILVNLKQSETVRTIEKYRK